MRLVIIAIVTLIVGGGIVGFMLYQNAQPDNVPQAAGTRQLSSFLSEEHQAAARAGNTDQFTVTTAQELMEQTGVWIGRRMEFDDSLMARDSGLRFIGGRQSQVPGPGTSAHLLFSTTDGAWASVFLQQYRQHPEVTINTSLTLTAPSGTAPIVVWRPGGQIYYLVSERQEGVDALRKALNIPAPTTSYPR